MARPSPVQWLMLGVGLVLVWRYAWIMDDAFVYARYADNVVLMGFGLVYNAGEYVEGFTSPLWMMWLLALRGLGVDLWWAWLGTGLAAFTAAWWLLVRIDAKMSPSTARLRVYLPMAYLAGNYAFTSWFSSGLETPLLQLAAIGYAWFLLEPRHRGAQVLVGLSPLVRPELAVAVVVALGLAAWHERRVPWIAVGVAGVTQLGWLTFRVWYYADLLPNTFYLKHDPDPAQGGRYLVNAFGSYHLEILAALVVGCLVVARRAGVRPLWIRARLSMAATALPVIAYAVWIGGDAIHYRYLAFGFCLLVCASAGAVEAALAARAEVAAWVPATITTLVLAAAIAMQPPQRTRHALLGPGGSVLVDGISDTGRHRRNEKFRRLAHHDPLEGRRPTEYAGVLATSWCAKAYFELDQRIVHSLGLTEPFLARARAPADRPGHKYDLEVHANALAGVYRWHAPPARGTMRGAVARRMAPGWVEPQLDAIEIIERKIDNDHDLVENLGLAFTSVPPLDLERRD